MADSMFLFSKYLLFVLYNQLSKIVFYITYIGLHVSLSVKSPQSELDSKYLRQGSTRAPLFGDSTGKNNELGTFSSPRAG